MQTTSERAPGETDVSVALVSADTDLTATFLAAAAAAGVGVRQIARADELRPAWASAAQVYLGLDVAEAVHATGLPRRAGVSLLARPGTAGVSRWSVAFDASVVELPDTDGVLMTRLAVAAGAAGGEVVVLTGASGGVGVSTLALGLGRTLAEGGRSVLVVDLDARGGGLDLAAGAESAPGWRWPELALARGQIGDLTGQLPEVDGVRLLAMARDGSAPPSTEAVSSVLATARRWFDVTVVDASGSAQRWLPAAASVASRCWLVVRGDVPGLAAGAQHRVRLTDGAPVELVVQTGPGAGVGREVVEEVVGAPLLLAVPDDRRLRVGAARGEPARGSRRWRRAVRRLAASIETTGATGGAS